MHPKRTRTMATRIWAAGLVYPFLIFKLGVVGLLLHAEIQICLFCRDGLSLNQYNTPQYRGNRCVSMLLM